MEEFTKDQLSEAFSTVRGMQNAFKAFKNAEESILLVIQVRESIDKNKALAAELASQTEQLAGDLRILKEKYAQEVLVLDESRKAELAAVKIAVANARTAATREIGEYREKIASMDREAEGVKTRFKELVALCDSEIKEKDAILADLTEQYAAMKKKFA